MIGTIPYNMESQQVGLQTQDFLYVKIHSSNYQQVIPHILCDTYIQTTVAEIW